MKIIESRNSVFFCTVVLWCDGTKVQGVVANLIIANFISAICTYFKNSRDIWLRDHPFKMLACLRGEGCPHVPMVQRSQYIRIKNPLHKHIAGMPMVGGQGSKILKICRRLK